MRRPAAWRRWIEGLVPAIALAATLACGGYGGSPTASSTPQATQASATFRLVGGGQDGTITYTNGPNLVFCRQEAGFADLWIRFAAQTAANGQNGPHLDIDVCNLGDGGTFSPMNPQAATCGAAKTFDIWWHGGSDVFVNSATSPACTLTVTRDGTRLSGTFGCQGLGEVDGTRSVAVLEGSFQCVEQ